jgi:hypothetical protein
MFLREITCVFPQRKTTQVEIWNPRRFSTFPRMAELERQLSQRDLLIKSLDDRLQRLERGGQLRLQTPDAGAADAAADSSAEAGDWQTVPDANASLVGSAVEVRLPADDAAPLSGLALHAKTSGTMHMIASDSARTRADTSSLENRIADIEKQMGAGGKEREIMKEQLASVKVREWGESGMFGGFCGSWCAALTAPFTIFVPLFSF